MRAINLHYKELRNYPVVYLSASNVKDYLANYLLEEFNYAIEKYKEININNLSVIYYLDYKDKLFHYEKCVSRIDNLIQIVSTMKYGFVGLIDNSKESLYTDNDIINTIMRQCSGIEEMESVVISLSHSINKLPYSVFNVIQNNIKTVLKRINVYDEIQNHINFDKEVDIDKAIKTFDILKGILPDAIFQKYIEELELVLGAFNDMKSLK